MRGEQTPFTALESHFLNTFFSGIYLSATDMLHIAQSVGIELKMSSRELLIKELFNRGVELDTVTEIIEALVKIVDERVAELEEMMRLYPRAAEALLKLHTKAKATKRVLLEQMRSNPYEQ